MAEVGTPRISGGAVRDWLLEREPEDLDVEVFDVSWKELMAVLNRLGKVNEVGKAFGVAKLRVEAGEIDFSMPRLESKTDPGHKGFVVRRLGSLDQKRAAARRDFTINSMAYDWKDEVILDPFNGRKDLESRILRHTSEAFVEDPLRVLRGFQFCSRFHLTAAEETIELCQGIKRAYHELPVERIWMEWEKWATRSARPSLGLKFLKETGWMTHYPELNDLVNCPQDPLWHPEGDVFVHTCHCLDAMVGLETYKNADRSGRLALMFATLTHDIGKPSTTVQKEKEGAVRWVSPGHDQAGPSLAGSFLQSIGAPPLGLIPRVKALVSCHMAAIQIQERPSRAQVRRLARKLRPGSLAELFAVIRADQAGRPPRHPGPSQGLLELEAVAVEESLASQAPRPIVLGRHLLAKGLEPGPQFKTILDALFERQLDGEFSSLKEAQPFIDELGKEGKDGEMEKWSDGERLTTEATEGTEEGSED